MIHAFHDVAKAWPEPLSLVLPGRRAREYNDLEMLAEMKGIADRVLFPGPVPVDDLARFYNGAEVFVYPSLYEGFGLPPLEAMACGTPALVAHTSSLPEVVGEGGRYFEPFDVETLAAYILEILADEDCRNHWSRMGLERAAQFSWEKMARETLTVYRKAVESR